MVVNRLLDLHTFKDVPWREMAILYRTNAQSRPLEEALRKRGLPYKIYGGLSFYQRKEVKDVIAYLRILQYRTRYKYHNPAYRIYWSYKPLEHNLTVEPVIERAYYVLKVGQVNAVTQR